MKTQRKKELDGYIQKLNLTTKGEVFVLETILRMDWNRYIILLNIEKIEYNNPKCPNLVWVKCRTRDGLYSFTAGHVGTRGWITDNITEQEGHVEYEVRRKLK